MSILRRLAPTLTRIRDRPPAAPTFVLLTVLFRAFGSAASSPEMEVARLPAHHATCEAPSATRDVPSAQRELLAADRAFARATAEEGASGWASWFLPAGEMVVPGARVRGSSEILAVMKGAFSDPAYRIRWAPETALVSPDGSRGFTTGCYETVRSGREGEPVTTEGRYLTVWERDETGHWRVSLDVGIPDPGEDDRP